MPLPEHHPPISPHHVDEFLYVMSRRLINEEYAEEPVDFNLASLETGQLLIGRAFTANDRILDIGSSSGMMMRNARIVMRTEAQIICTDPDTDASAMHASYQDSHQADGEVLYVQAQGEHLPFPDNIATGVTLHNVIFRSNNPLAMLKEAKRIVKVGGFLAVSSNYEDHAPKRHSLEREAAELLRQEYGISVDTPRPPAEGKYMEDLPKLLMEVGGLAIAEDLYVEQDTRAKITPGNRLDSYLRAIKYSAAGMSLSPAHHSLWRAIVDKYIRHKIEYELVINAISPLSLTPDFEASFDDPIHRGMFTLRKES